MDSRKQLDKKIRQHVRKRPLVLLGGVYGNAIEGKEHAYVEEVMKTDEGLCTKLYGCSYLLRGYPDRERVLGIGTMKRVIVASARLIKRLPFLLLLLVFFKKQILVWLSDIYRGGAFYIMPTKEEMTSVGREIIRVGYEMTENADMRNLIYFFAGFIELDNTYRIRFQDIFGEARDALEALSILSRRDFQIADRIRLLKHALKITKVRKIFDEFIAKLDKDKIRMTESDLYFALGNKEYAILGLSEGLRVEIKQEIDIAKGHILLTL